MALHMLRGVDSRLLWKFAYNFGWKGMLSIRRFEKRQRNGEFFPAFVFISVTNGCNLSCQGCWVTPSRPRQDMDPAMLDRIIRESKAHGSSFFGILGGEPLLHGPLTDILARHPDCYFLLFTNGTLINEEIAHTWRRLGNVSPLISIEGNEIVSDRRRGGRCVLSRSLQGMAHCRSQRLVHGVATSVCRSNLKDLASESFVRQVEDLGAHYLWYYIYRPVGPNPSPELVLSAEEILRLRRFMVDIRSRTSLMIVDSYWDHEGRALCPAAVGISHHINPAGEIEPCPPIQFATDRLSMGQELAPLMGGSEFLRAFRATASPDSRGCILMENPQRLSQLVVEAGARDTSGRGTALAELNSMQVVPCHHLPGQEIPERYWPYRLAKKRWFFGFGAYG